MENEFLKAFKSVVRECNYDNTYKMALARALVEESILNKTNEEEVIIPMTSLARYFLKFYWDQTIFFDLIQGSNPNKPPVVLQAVKDLINKYFEFTKDNKPIIYVRAEEILENNLQKDLGKAIGKIAVELPKNVVPRFLKLGKNEYNFYDYTKTYITIKKSYLNILKDNSDDLFVLVNYRLGLMLENFNSSPRINKKVKILDDQKIDRKSLNRFKVWRTHNINVLSVISQLKMKI